MIVTIKKASADEAQLLFAICRQSYVENFANHWNEGGLDWYLDKVYGLEIIQSDLSNPDINYFVAYIDEEPAGFMKLHLNALLPGHPATTAMEIEKIYFLTIAQGKGIGKKLITLSIELAKQLKKEIIWLGVIDTNESAIAFYQKMGFHLHDKTRLDVPYFKEELKGMWRMVLPLT